MVLLLRSVETRRCRLKRPTKGLFYHEKLSQLASFNTRRTTSSLLESLAALASKLCSVACCHSSSASPFRWPVQRNRNLKRSTANRTAKIRTHGCAV